MTTDLSAIVAQAAADSPLLRAAAAVRRDGGVEWCLGPRPSRPLTVDQIERLERAGNVADDWSRVRVAAAFDVRRVRGCTFSGDVVLGRFTGRAELAGGTSLPTGVYDSVLADCVVGDDALVRCVRLLANHIVGPGAVLFNCGLVTAGAECRFGNGTTINVGPQSRPRPVPAFAELDVATAAAVARPRGRHASLEGYARAVAAYAAEATSARGIIERGAAVFNVPRLEGSYLGPACRIDGAAVVADCTLLSEPGEPTSVGPGSVLTGCLLQPGASAGPGATLERSVLMRNAHAGRHAKVADSLLGPSTAVAVGEVTACLLGPLVSAHHQSLLISLVWPGGRGNVAHGANVGSNHTSRCADQECWPAEGMFFGLGVNVKFPANFSRAPYTMIAPGVTTAPQSVEYPFSLISARPAAPANLPPEIGEIRPGWVLSQNLYALRRTEAKHRARYATNAPRVDLAVIRPDTVELMRVALHRLRSVPEVKPYYTAKDCPGLGKNALAEAARLDAITAYHGAVAVYALTGLRDRLAERRVSGGRIRWEDLLHAPSNDPCWEYQRALLVGDLGIGDAATALAQLAALLEGEAARVEQSRAKDGVRGCRIIDDYFEHHEAARDDELVRSTSARVEKNLRELRGLINGLGEFAVQREGRAEPAATAPPPRRAAGEFIPAPG